MRHRFVGWMRRCVITDKLNMLLTVDSNITVKHSSLLASVVTSQQLGQASIRNAHQSTCTRVHKKHTLCCLT